MPNPTLLRNARQLSIAAATSAGIALLAAARTATIPPTNARFSGLTILSALIVALPFAWIGWRAWRDAQWLAQPTALGAARALAWVALADAVLALLQVLPMARLPGTAGVLMLMGVIPNPNVVLGTPVPAGLTPRMGVLLLAGFVAAQVVILRSVRATTRNERDDVHYWWGALGTIVCLAVALRVAHRVTMGYGGILASTMAPASAMVAGVGAPGSAQSAPKVVDELTVARIMNLAHACAHLAAAKPGAHGFPPSLAAMGPSGDGCLAATALSDSIRGWSLTYTPAAADSAGVIAGYRLDAQTTPGAPGTVGRAPLHGDESGIIIHESNPDPSYSYYTPLRSLIRLRECLEMYRLQRSQFGYPSTLAAMSVTGNGCLLGEDFRRGADSASVRLAGFGYLYDMQYARVPTDTMVPGTGIQLGLRPVRYGANGVRSYTLDDSGHVHATPDDRAATPADPMLPLCGAVPKAAECQHTRSLPRANREVTPTLRLIGGDTTVFAGADRAWTVVIENGWLGNGPYEYHFVFPDNGEITDWHTSDKGGNGYYEPSQNPLTVESRHAFAKPGRYVVPVTVTDAMGRVARAAFHVKVIAPADRVP